MNGLNSKTYTNAPPFKNSDLAKNLKFDKEEKAELNALVASVTPTQIISSDTTGLADSIDCKQIYVYQIVLTGNKMPYKVIEAIDKFTQALTVFEIIDSSGQYTYTLAQKKFGDKGITIGYYTSRTTTGEYQLPQDYPLKSVGDIYKLITAFVLNLTLKNDTIEGLYTRKKRIAELEKELAKLEKKKQAEVQFNKKVELNDSIRAIKAQIEGER